MLGIEFNPRESGSIGGSVVLSDNTLNARFATQRIALQGTATTPLPAATAVKLAAEPGSVRLGRRVTLTASVSSATAGSIGGSVTFKVGTRTVGSAPVSGGRATLHDVTVSAANGFGGSTNSITAAYGGDADFAASSGSAKLTLPHGR